MFSKYFYESIVLITFILALYAYLSGRGRGQRQRGRGRGGPRRGLGLGPEPEQERRRRQIHVRMPTASPGLRSWPPSGIKWIMEALALELHCLNTTILRFETEIKRDRHSPDGEQIQFLVFENDRLLDRRIVVCRQLLALERAYTFASQ